MDDPLTIFRMDQRDAQQQKMGLIPSIVHISNIIHWKEEKQTFIQAT